MSRELEQVLRTAPDLVGLDPLSTEVRTWFDRAYDAVKRVDEVEAVVLAMHQRYLLDPAEKTIARAEIIKAINRAIRTSTFLQCTATATGTDPEQRTAA